MRRITLEYASSDEYKYKVKESGVKEPLNIHLHAFLNRSFIVAYNLCDDGGVTVYLPPEDVIRNKTDALQALKFFLDTNQEYYHRLALKRILEDKK